MEAFSVMFWGTLGLFSALVIVFIVTLFIAMVFGTYLSKGRHTFGE